MATPTRMVLTRLVIALRRTKDWLIAHMIFSLLRLIALFPADPAIGFVDRMARRIGPLTRRHKLALTNLARAYPEKTEAEHEMIARDMWGNMSRLATEYVFLDQLFDFDPEASEPGRIEVEGAEIFLKLRDTNKPFIVFTAHTGNFELLPIAAASYGLDVMALFRPPNNPYIAAKVLAARQTSMGHLVPSRAGAAFALARRLESGRGVGLLVDQKFHKGAKTRFFGLDAHTNPLLAKLVRQYECDVYPARSIRLPNGRHRLEIEPAIPIPRQPGGGVDIAATAQLLNDKVESWVREHPGQWQWFHDRWQIKHLIK
ncbi:lipid A biosynthesis lauroyl acyltransferase [Hoeflea sp. YIM 152468]|uniref:lipid A biosynthesis lauroyl acyltransferase n=1 Tax=Hoeflea sp. YIM 152468 TaxID=3031759 RepID=UPI0023DAF259|nr:lipid A biosynthesis lauroyl acyltransferase [Hoeflea sp. YIM 152468]MDF1607643.1 lipid A biosynthesis lauroyl acyltransferase [Hoeflea sp. YIM 152468]